VLSPVIGLFCHRHLARLLARLDAGVEASGPHDLAVRVSAIRQRRRRVHRIPPGVRDDRERPSVGRDGENIQVILFRKNRNIFRKGAGQQHQVTAWQRFARQANQEVPEVTEI
jgi:hypothetical protein